MNNVGDEMSGSVNNASNNLSTSVNGLGTTDVLRMSGGVFGATAWDALSRGGQGLVAALAAAPGASGLASMLTMSPTTADISWYIQQSLPGVPVPALSAAIAAAGSSQVTTGNAIIQSLVNGLVSVKNGILAIMRTNNFSQLSSAQFTEYYRDKQSDMTAAITLAGDGTLASATRILAELDKDYYAVYANTNTTVAQLLQTQLPSIKETFATSYLPFVQAIVSGMSQSFFAAFLANYQAFRGTVVAAANGGQSPSTQLASAGPTSVAATVALSGVATTVPVSTGTASGVSTRTDMGLSGQTLTNQNTGTTSQVVLMRGQAAPAPAASSSIPLTMSGVVGG